MHWVGYGFLEKVYENALAYELARIGLNPEQQKPLQVYYDGRVVGEFFADIIVDNRVILELKAVERLTEAHGAQLLNYLSATECEVGLVLNFGPEARFMRRVMDNRRKKHLNKM